jgi:hypothetical protein
MKAWEASEMDEKHDKQHSMKGLRHGGKVHAAGCTCSMCGGRIHKDQAGAVTGDGKNSAKQDTETTSDEYRRELERRQSGRKHGGRIERARGGAAKSKGTNVIINLSSPEHKHMPIGMPPMAPPVPQLPPVPPPMPPGGMGAPAGVGPGMGAMPALPGGAPVPPMRKAGGRVNKSFPKYQETKYGSGSGLGRLEKTKWPPANG